MIEFSFFLKKLVSYFMEPLGMVLILLAVGLYFFFIDKKRFAKFFLSSGFSLMLLYSYSPIANFLILNLENQYPKYSYEKKIKYIHVLGSGHNTDNTQPLSSQLGGASVKRDLEGILIHLKTANSKIIFTGYEGMTDIPTAQMNAKLAIALGIKEDNLIINGIPKDTKEEALFTQMIVGDEPFVLVTSATHMPRAMILFKSLGLNPIAAPTNFYKSESHYFSLPTLENFYKSKIAIHEYLGILWAKLRG